MQHGVTNNFALLLARAARRPVRALQARLPQAGVQTGFGESGCVEDARCLETAQCVSASGSSKRHWCWHAATLPLSVKHQG
jgi:hypothetical protein